MPVTDQHIPGRSSSTPRPAWVLLLSYPENFINLTALIDPAMSRKSPHRGTRTLKPHALRTLSCSLPLPLPLPLRHVLHSDALNWLRQSSAYDKASLVPTSNRSFAKAKTLDREITTAQQPSL